MSSWQDVASIPQDADVVTMQTDIEATATESDILGKTSTNSRTSVLQEFWEPPTVDASSEAALDITAQIDQSTVLTCALDVFLSASPNESMDGSAHQTESVSTVDYLMHLASSDLSSDPQAESVDIEVALQENLVISECKVSEAAASTILNLDTKECSVCEDKSSPPNLVLRECPNIIERSAEKRWRMHPSLVKLLGADWDWEEWYKSLDEISPMEGNEKSLVHGAQSIVEGLKPAFHIQNPKVPFFRPIMFSGHIVKDFSEIPNEDLNPRVCKGETLLSSSTVQSQNDTVIHNASHVIGKKIIVNDYDMFQVKGIDIETTCPADTGSEVTHPEAPSLEETQGRERDNIRSGEARFETRTGLAPALMPKGQETDDSKALAPNDPDQKVVGLLPLEIVNKINLHQPVVIKTYADASNLYYALLDEASHRELFPDSAASEQSNENMSPVLLKPEVEHNLEHPNWAEASRQEDLCYQPQTRIASQSKHTDNFDLRREKPQTRKEIDYPRNAIAVPREERYDLPELSASSAFERKDHPSTPSSGTTTYNFRTIKPGQATRWDVGKEAHMDELSQHNIEDTVVLTQRPSSVFRSTKSTNQFDETNYDHKGLPPHLSRGARRLGDRQQNRRIKSTNDDSFKHVSTFRSFSTNGPHDGFETSEDTGRFSKDKDYRSEASREEIEWHGTRGDGGGYGWTSSRERDQDGGGLASGLQIKGRASKRLEDFQDDQVKSFESGSHGDSGRDHAADSAGSGGGRFNDQSKRHDYYCAKSPGGRKGQRQDNFGSLEDEHRDAYGNRSTTYRNEESGGVGGCQESYTSSELGSGRESCKVNKQEGYGRRSDYRSGKEEIPMHKRRNHEGTASLDDPTLPSADNGGWSSWHQPEAGAEGSWTQ